MDRSYEKFRGGPTQPAKDRLHVTINRAHVISLNKNAHRQLGKPTAVYLFFSREKDTIALEPASHRLNESFPVRERDRSGWRINAAPFCRHFNIKIEGATKFITPEIKNGILHLNLSETISVAQVRRKKRGFGS